MSKIARRNFLSLPAGLFLSARKAGRKILILVLDGCGPDYIERIELPVIRRMMRDGLYVTGKGVVPSVTCVNIASLLTGSFPKDHGVTGSYYYNRALAYSEEITKIDLRSTVFRRAKKAGFKTAIVSAKTAPACGADIEVSAENPPTDLTASIGPRANPRSPEIDTWSFRAARAIMAGGADLVFLATSDHMMHAYAPSEEPVQAHLREIDKQLGEMLNDYPGLEIYLTADHGMSEKTEAIDLGRVFAAAGVQADAVPVHKEAGPGANRSLSGSSYVFVRRRAETGKVTEILKQTSGIEDVIGGAQAAETFGLKADLIGDLLVLANEQSVFGAMSAPRDRINLRAHGSLHETRVPILVYGRKYDAAQFQMNLDLIRNLDLKG